MKTVTRTAVRVKSTVTRFDSKATAALIPAGFGLAADPTGAEWDAMAEESMMQDAIDRGIAGCDLAPLPPVERAESTGEVIPATVTRISIVEMGSRRTNCVRHLGAWVQEGTRKTRMTFARANEYYRAGRIAILADAAPTAPVEPTASDRAWWAAQTIGAASDGFAIEGEARSFARTGKNGSSPRQVARKPRQTWEQSRDAEIEAVRPAGSWANTPEWDTFGAESSRIERAYA